MLPIFLKPKVTTSLIRIGSRRDGGYFVPKKIINKINKIVSFGLGSDWSFEEDFKKKNNSIKIVFYDHTINIYFWLKSFIQNLYFLIRYKNSIKNLFKLIEYNTFFNQRNIEHKKLKVSNKTNIQKHEISISDILKKEKTKFLLKIDIEGDEYLILNKILKFQKNIDCLIIEFHQINKKKNKNKIRYFMKKIKQLKNCNISPNNSFGFDKNNDPYVFEMVFVNKKYLNKKEFKTNNNPKYFPNNPYKKNFEIKFIK